MLYYFNRICYSIVYSLYVFTSRRIDDYLQSYNPVATEVRITRVIFSDVLRVLPKGRRKWTWNSRNRYTYAIRATRIVNNNVRYVMRWRVNGLSRDRITVVYIIYHTVYFLKCVILWYQWMKQRCSLFAVPVAWWRGGHLWLFLRNGGWVFDGWVIAYG